jgi:hypothetical protein
MSEEPKKEGDFKMKKKPKKLSQKETITKVDFKKQEEEAIEESQEEKAKEIEASSANSVKEVEVQGEVKEEPVKEEVVEETVEETVEVIEEVIEEIKEEEIKKVINETPEVNLPENVEKLVNFMKETGGDINDYVNLNKDYSSLDNEELLNEYYKQLKPHLNNDEVSFLLEDKFSWDDENDEERDIKLKKLYLKEEIAKAKTYLNNSKSKYYDDIKLRSNSTQGNKEALDFYNKHNEEQKVIRERHNNFKDTTQKFFNNDFKGFDFNVGEKRFKYKVNNPNDVATNQSDLNNFVGKFLNKQGEISDVNGYHKALYAARNADSIAKHFYEQGKTDAIKDVTARSKNIQQETRPSQGDVFVNGLRVKAISGSDGSKLKFKTKK